MSVPTQKRSFEPLDELRYGLISSARLSPDGKWVVYALTQNDLEKEEITSSLWRISLESGETRRLTYGNMNTAPEWSPDGRQIAFLSNREGKQQVYLMSSEGGEARALTNLKQGVGGGPVWSPDGQSIAFTAGLDAEPPDPGKPYRVKRFVYRFDGIGNLDHAVQNIYIQPVAGGAAKQLTDDAHLDHSMRWSPDGKALLYLAAHNPDHPELFYSRLRVVDLDGRVDELAGPGAGFFISNFRASMPNAAWMPDGRRIIFAASTGRFPMGSKADLWIIDRKGGAPQNYTADDRLGVYNGVGKLLDAKTLLITVMAGGRIGISSLKLAANSKPKALIGGDRSLTLQDANSQQILFLSSTLENPSELCIADVNGRNERQITQINSALVSEIAFPKVENLRFRNDEGIEIEGWLLLPTTGRPPYPTILYIHGGPHGAYGFRYGSDFQMLAGAGYAVLFTNPRGSRGYGDDFSTALSGNWGIMDYKDLMAGVDYVIEQGYADPDRLGVAGLSYGGFLTTFTVGQTQRFRAAVAENPITDLVSRYGTADMGPWGSLSELGGKPHEIPDVYRRSSPITYAHQCTTPTLLVQGEADYRCPMGQSEQFYAHLKATGCITEMVRLPGMAHVASITGPIIMQKTQNEALLGWMNKYVLGKR